MNHRVCLLICGTLFLSAALAIPVEDAEQKDHVIKIFDVAVRQNVQEAQNDEVQYKDCWKQCKKSGPCAYCGDKHMCCRHNERHGGCNGGGPAWRHGCQGGYPITYHRHHKHHRHHRHHTHRPNQNCWDKCNKKDGKCAWCGAGGYCCRNSGIFSQKGGCWNTNDNHWRHVCQYNKPAEVVEEIADTEDIKDTKDIETFSEDSSASTAKWSDRRRRRPWHRWHHHIQPTPSPTSRLLKPTKPPTAFKSLGRGYCVDDSNQVMPNYQKYTGTSGSLDQCEEYCQELSGCVGLSYAQHHSVGSGLCQLHGASKGPDSSWQVHAANSPATKITKATGPGNYECVVLLKPKKPPTAFKSLGRGYCVDDSNQVMPNYQKYTGTSGSLDQCEEYCQELSGCVGLSYAQHHSVGSGLCQLHGASKGPDSSWQIHAANSPATKITKATGPGNYECVVKEM